MNSLELIALRLDAVVLGPEPIPLHPKFRKATKAQISSIRLEDRNGNEIHIGDYVQVYHITNTLHKIKGISNYTNMFTLWNGKKFYSSEVKKVKVEL